MRINISLIKNPNLQSDGRLLVVILSQRELVEISTNSLCFSSKNGK